MASPDDHMASPDGVGARVIRTSRLTASVRQMRPTLPKCLRPATRAGSELMIAEQPSVLN